MNVSAQIVPSVSEEMSVRDEVPILTVRAYAWTLRKFDGKCQYWTDQGEFTNEISEAFIRGHSDPVRSAMAQRGHSKGEVSEISISIFDPRLSSFRSLSGDHVIVARPSMTSVLPNSASKFQLVTHSGVIGHPNFISLFAWKAVLLPEKDIDKAFARATADLKLPLIPSIVIENGARRPRAFSQAHDFFVGRRHIEVRPLAS